MIKFKTYLLFFILIFRGLHSSAVNDIPKDSTKIIDHPIKDAAAVFRSVFQLKERAAPIDTTPFRLFKAILPGFGYTILTGPSAVLASNLSFYLGSASNTNISSITFSPEYALKGQGILFLSSNIWTPGNAFNVVGDNKYYFYTLRDFGLGCKYPIFQTGLNSTFQIW